MAFNLRNRSFLKEIDTEVKHVEGTVGREIMKRTALLEFPRLGP